MLSDTTTATVPVEYWETEEWKEAVHAAFVIRMELFSAANQAPKPDDFQTHTIWRAACAEYDADVMAPIRERLGVAAAARDAIARQAVET